MFDAIFEKLNIPGFSRLLSASGERQRTIAENIANIATPGYKAKDVDFSQILRSESKRAVVGERTDARHIPIGETVPEGRPPIVKDNSAELRSGENNVDVDMEMAKSAENQLYYAATSKMLAGKFRALHLVVKGR
ncbi:MAG: flagellar basal body rod protein FlgB [Calditrichaeota bacterium]|nr:flagellar basal body rod protein FlgB [Calditrichota bacterium]